MKKTIKSILALLLIALCAVSFCSCVSEEKPQTETTSVQTENTTEAQLPELWSDALYTEDKEFGNGEKTLTVEVTAGDKTVTFTVKTDKDTVGAALIEHGLVTGEDGPYGLYIKTVNGILADYDIDQSYWAFYIGEESAITGVDSTDIAEGTTYKLVYTK